MSQLIPINLDELIEYDQTDAEVFFSLPFKKENSYIYQYRIEITDREIILDLIKSAEENECDDEEEEIYCIDNSITLKNIIRLPLKEGKKKIYTIIQNWDKNVKHECEDNNAKNVLNMLYNEYLKV